MPEIKRFKKLYRPLTPEQRQKTLDSTITKRVASFDRMDERHFRKLTKHAKESKEAELKRLRKKLKVALKFEKASEADKETDPELICIPEYTQADVEQWKQEIEVGQKCKPEAIATMAFRRLHKELTKIAEKAKARKEMEAAAKKAEEEAAQKAAEDAAAAEAEASLKRERPDDSADLPKPKKSKKNKKAKDGDATATEAAAEPEVKPEIKEEPEIKQETVGPAVPPLPFDPKKVPAPDGAKYGQQMGMSKWGQQKAEQGASLLPAIEDNSVMNQFVQRVMKHPMFNDHYLVVKKIQLQQKAKFEKFKQAAAKHQILAEQKALENGLNPPPPKGKKGKKAQQQKKKKKFVKMTEEERKAAKKFKYNKNKERNKLREIEKKERIAARAAQQNANQGQA